MAPEHSEIWSPQIARMLDATGRLREAILRDAARRLLQKYGGFLSEKGQPLRAPKSILRAAGREAADEAIWQELEAWWGLGVLDVGPMAEVAFGPSWLREPSAWLVLLLSDLALAGYEVRDDRTWACLDARRAFLLGETSYEVLRGVCEAALVGRGFDDDVMPRSADDRARTILSSCGFATCQMVGAIGFLVTQTWRQMYPSLSATTIERAMSRAVVLLYGPLREALHDKEPAQYAAQLDYALQQTRDELVRLGSL
jgi:hypothetical protein